MKKSKLSFVIPAYNEAGNIPVLYKELKKIFSAKYIYEIIFVDDGSTDDTLSKIKKLTKKDNSVRYLSFTRNFGHQNAIKAGLDKASGDAVVTLDADMQHPPSTIPQMVKLWEKGYKIVYSKRAEGQGSLTKNLSSSLFYKLINSLSSTKIDSYSADFRLLDRQVVEILRTSQESTLFLRGLVAWSGYETASVAYKPGMRSWGETKYSLPRMIQLAVDAITSFSTIPLRLATIIGFLMSLLSGVYGLYAVFAWITKRPTVIIGWPSVIISVLFIGGLQLLILGILGEYVGKIFLEVKNRPLYVVKDSNIK